MKELENYLSLVATILGLLITTITFCLKFIKNAKARKIAQGILKITTALIPLVEEAEALSYFNGAEKKTYVMAKITKLMSEQGLSLPEIDISDKIEMLIDLTKQVNVQKTSEIKQKIKGEQNEF